MNQERLKDISEELIKKYKDELISLRKEEYQRNINSLPQTGTEWAIVVLEENGKIEITNKIKGESYRINVMDEMPEKVKERIRDSKWLGTIHIHPKNDWFGGTVFSSADRRVHSGKFIGLVSYKRPTSGYGMVLKLASRHEQIGVIINPLVKYEQDIK